MTFSAPFRRTFSPVFDRLNAGGAWWNLFGAIPNANVAAAFQPKGAASLAASYVNLVTPGVNDAAAGTAPTWDATDGWQFVAASTQYLLVGAGAILTAPPITFIASFKSSDILSSQNVLSIARDNTAANAFRLLLSGNVVGDPIGARSVSGGTGGTASTTTGYSINTWHVGAAVFVNDASRSAYIDGGSKGSETTSVTVTSANKTYIGVTHSGVALTAYLTGYIRACAIYNIALSDAQVLALTTAMAAL